MALFAISFRIGDGADYDKRWQSVVDVIRREATGSKWDETTSFFLINSNKSAAALCSTIYLGSSLLETRDQLLVINLSIKEHDQRGAEYPNTLEALMATR